MAKADEVLDGIIKANQECPRTTPEIINALFSFKKSYRGIPRETMFAMLLATAIQRLTPAPEENDDRPAD